MIDTHPNRAATKERTTTRRFRQVDVFGQDPGTGNPVAVLLDSAGLTDEDRPRFSQWTNLSECTFLTPPTDPAADYRVPAS